jgi:hypothetical protein
MENQTRSINLGTILCKHCNEMIDTLDTDRVIIYYGVCDQKACVGQSNNYQTISMEESEERKPLVSLRRTIQDC